jgi:hypothetical protein
MNPSSLDIDFFSGIRELTAFGSPNTFENISSARQLVTCSLNDTYIIIYQLFK